MKIKVFILFGLLISIFGCIDKIKREDDNLEVKNSFLFESEESTIDYYFFKLETNKLNYTLRIVLENKADSKIEGLKISKSEEMSDVSFTTLKNIEINPGEKKALQFGLWGDKSAFSNLDEFPLLCKYKIDGKDVKSLIYVEYEVEEVTLE